MARSVLEDLQARLSATRQELESEFEAELAEQRERFRYTLHRGKVRFEHDIRELQRRYRVGLLKYIVGAPLGFVLSAPLIYGLMSLAIAIAAGWGASSAFRLLNRG